MVGGAVGVGATVALSYLASRNQALVDYTGTTFTAGSLTVNPVTFTVTKNGSPVELTQKEYDLLHHLITARGVVFSREELMQKVWNYAYFGDMRTVDVTIRRLREKIEDDPGKPALIMTKRGVGYYFAE